ncbi:DUF4386 domain-containing protein [Flexithrix dorotheae]|uniref:DUF4386 domain-containing protein n=1 Tax=Flexithrix dorotheae TaxID=70993 RepID=UPI0003622211|nr:DUF4386 domain-containing protein [Flexithrix dorotheae]
MELEKRKTRVAGMLLILALVAGILSVAPAVDAADFLTKAAAHPNQVISGTIFQFIMGLVYLSFALLLFPKIKSYGESLALGFLSFRIIAAGLVVLGSILLMEILALSQAFVSEPAQTPEIETLGNLLKTTRDYVNHVFMILVLCAGNLLFYILLFKSRLIPKWLSVWALSATLLSVIASLLLLFQVLEVITTEYLILNTPTALFEVTLGIRLIAKGFDKGAIENLS